VTRSLVAKKFGDLSLWVKAAIAEESRRPSGELWKGATSADDAYNERLRRIKCLRRHGSKANCVADRLEGCDVSCRCLSGACPECGRLLQRWFVRQSKKFISDGIRDRDQPLAALSIIPADATVSPGKLAAFSSVNFQRRLKYALDEAGIGPAVGGVDFSFNEDRDARYPPFWCPHAYLITSSILDTQIKTLRKCFASTAEIPKPLMVTPLQNNASRRSYALKMTFDRRVGYEEANVVKDGGTRKCRNTTDDRLRASDRAELFICLNQIGLKGRVIFVGAKPVLTSSGVLIR
jgi:hypothetical protein